MNDVEELKQFVVAHAKAQGLPEERYRGVLGRIRNDDEGSPGSWTAQWSAAGAELADQGRHLEAAGCYNMARFPFVDGPARQAALGSCVDLFGAWAQAQQGLKRLDVDLPTGRVACWVGGLSATPRPLVILMGGIVSVKEQWGPILPQADRLGLTIAVTEMPGVGENTLRYDLDSRRMLPAVVEAVQRHSKVSSVLASGLSFSGHLALRWAAEDPRVRGLLTVGAPISEFFTDADWFRQLPRVTVDTLVHLTGTPEKELLDMFRTEGWALSPDMLRSLDIPVYYTASRRDEIIPQGDIRLLRENVRRLSLNEYDDVHGSPEHSAEIRLWVPNSLLRMSGARSPQRVVLGTLLGAMRLRRRLAGTSARH
ncbi:MAG: alpha/beta hydrolase [Streptomyces sp.]|nr:alpha/beta hydrolase [Streptomyces sp.]